MTSISRAVDAPDAFSSSFQLSNDWYRVAPIHSPIPCLTIAHWQLNHLISGPSTSVWNTDHSNLMADSSLYCVCFDSVYQIPLRNESFPALARRYSFHPVCLDVIDNPGTSSAIIAVGGNAGQLGIGSEILMLGERCTTNGVTFAPPGSATGSRLWVCSNDKTVRIFDFQTCTALHTWSSSMFGEPINRLAVCPSHGFLAACVGDGKDLFLLDDRVGSSSSRGVVGAYRSVFQDAAFACSFDPSGRFVLAGSQKGDAILLDTRSQRVLRKFDKLSPRVHGIRVIQYDTTFSGISDLVAVGDHDGMVAVLDARTPDLDTVLEVQAGRRHRFSAVSAAGRNTGIPQPCFGGCTWVNGSLIVGTGRPIQTNSSAPAELMSSRDDQLLQIHVDPVGRRQSASFTFT
eukprot:ANDGO_04252.mRNA.1 hypothetical protein